MKQEQPVGDIKFSFVVIGRILLMLGLFCAVLHLVPFMVAYSKKESSKKAMEYSAEEKRKLETPMSITNRRMVLLSNGHNVNGSAKVKGNLEKEKLEFEYRQMFAKYNSLSRGEYSAEQALNKAQQTMDAKGIYAGISIALIIAGVLFIVFSRF